MTTDWNGRELGKPLVFDARTDPRALLREDGTVIPMRDCRVAVDGVDVTLKCFAVNQAESFADCYVVERPWSSVRKFKVDPLTKKPVVERKRGVVQVFTP